MLQTVAGALFPAIATLLLGYFAARHHQFGSQDASVLNRMVMTYALPFAIFVGTVSTDRAVLTLEVPLLVVLLLAIVGVYGVVFLACRFVLHSSLGVSALAALAASAPNAPYVGSDVLGYLYGVAGSIPVAIGSSIINLTVVPATVILLAVDASRRAGQSDDLAPTAAGTASDDAAEVRPELVGTILTALKEPIVWLPLLGFGIVLVGLAVPTLVAGSLALLGHSASDVALFAAGVVLAGYRVRITGAVLMLVAIKNIVQPALVWGGVFALGYTNPLLGEVVVSAALPMLVLVAMLGVQYRVGETEAASAVFISMVGSLLTMGAFIALTGA